MRYRTSPTSTASSTPGRGSSRATSSYRTSQTAATAASWRKGMQAKYKSMPCLGGYLDGTVETKVGKGNRRIFDGLDENWGNHRIALFQTSDCRNESHDDLGKHSTWVKWATPTAEALRQACLAEDSRISQKEPQLPCDQPTSADTDDIANPLSSGRRLIEATLKPLGGQVEIHFTLNSIPHVVRRQAETGETFLKVGDGELERAREDDVRALLPIHACSQKQLSSVSVRVEELNRFVTAPIRARLDDIDRSISDVSGRLRENYATLQRFRDLHANVARSVLLEKSLADQAANLRASLSGLSDEDRVLLDDKPAVDAARRAMIQWRRDLDQSVESVEALAQQILGTADSLTAITGAPATLSAPVETVRTENRSLLSGLASALASAAAAAAAHTALADAGTLASQRRSTEVELGRLDAAYEDVKARSTAHETKLAGLNDVGARRTTAADLLAEQQRELAGLGNPQEVHARLRSCGRGTANCSRHRTREPITRAGSLTPSSGRDATRPIGHDRPADPPHRHPVNGHYRPYATREIQAELQSGRCHTAERWLSVCSTSHRDRNRMSALGCRRSAHMRGSRRLGR
jgi:hypothetical protein